MTLPRASAPTRSSLLRFAFCPPRAIQEQKAGSAQEGLPPRPRCVRCCEPADQRFSYTQYQPLPQINMTILKGESCQGPTLQQCSWPNLQPRHSISLPGLPASSQGQHKAGLPVLALWDASLARTGSKKQRLVPVVQHPAQTKGQWAGAIVGCELLLCWWALGRAGGGASLLSPSFSARQRGFQGSDMAPASDSATLPPALPRREGGPR